ncbi:hypothetical protein LTR66_017713 [Elasticomyces elasticus]|nr:hypothetical protein LTR66_017713 [Elasticomyces elasticus]
MSNPIKIQSAIIMRGSGEAEVESDLCIPSPDAGQLLIRTHAIALNPSDAMALDNSPRPGSGMGYDFSGEVIEIGQGAQGVWVIGDRVAGFLHGCFAANYTTGAFREYLTADAELVIRLPPHLSFNEGSTLGMGMSTAAQALYQSLRIPLPGTEAVPMKQTVLVYGGSTATGSLAIQLAKM